jgi:hypothetical protein
MRLTYAVFVGYLADLMVGWTAVWLAPHTKDLTYKLYMAPGEWFVDPMKAPFVALLFWTTLFGVAWYYFNPKARVHATA